MKHLKLFEDFEEENSFDGYYVGIHCSPYTIDEFSGDITDEDFVRFPDILHTIKDDYPEASKYLELIENLNDEDEDATLELASDIEYFLKENHLEWIYVSTNGPLYKYGDNCYNVYFENSVYSISDDLVEDANVCIYDSSTNKPKLFSY